MFINSHVVPDSDIMVIFDYPSVNDAKLGHINDTNAKSYMYKALRMQGINCSRVSWHSVLNYPMGNNKVEDLFRTTKTAIKREDTVNQGGYFFEPSMELPFKHLFDAIREANPKYIVCTSSLALAAMGFGSSIDSWRGSMLEFEGRMVLPTYGPMFLYKSPERHLAFRRDLVRLKTPEMLWEMPNFKIEHKLSYEEVINRLETLFFLLARKTMLVAVDIETRAELISFIGFATSNREALVIPFIDVNGRSKWTVEQETEIVRLCRAVLAHPNIRVAGQNFQYDAQYIVKLWGVLPHIACDTMVEAHVLMTKGQKLSLSFLASLYCNWYRYWKEDGKDYHKSFQSEADYDRYGLYNGYDCCYTFEVAEALIKIHERAGNTLPIRFQRKMQNIVLRPVIRGIRYDKQKQVQLYHQYKQTISEYQAWLLWIIPQERVNTGGDAYWFDAPTQMSFLFYQQLGVEPVLKRNAKGIMRPSTDDEALIQIAKREPILKPLCEVLQAYRSLRQFFDLYLSAKVSEDGRMRTQYMVAGTDTFRLASKKDAFDCGMNLQNLSKG